MIYVRILTEIKQQISTTEPIEVQNLILGKVWQSNFFLFSYLERRPWRETKVGHLNLKTRTETDAITRISSLATWILDGIVYSWGLSPGCI